MYTLTKQNAIIEVTPEMTEAGVKAYEAWEPNHIFDGQDGAADYAKSDLASIIFRAMASVRHPSEQESPTD